MECTNCEDAIDPTTDKYYETVTPVVDSGTQTSDEYCSIACQNEDVGFSNDEIESLMRQSGYEVPRDFDSDWVVNLESELDDIAQQNIPEQSEYFTLYSHVSKNYDIEVFYDTLEQLYEVVLYTYDVVPESREKIGLEEIEKTHTSIHQRAIAHAESYMDKVEDM